MKKIFLILLMLMVLGGGALPAQAALVSCNTIANPTPCTICDVFKLFKTVIDFITFKLTPLIATLFIVISGVMMIAGGSSESLLGSGRSLFKNTLIGVVIVYSAFLLTNFIIKSLAGDNDIATSWFKLECVPPTFPSPTPGPSRTPPPDICDDEPALAASYNEPYPRTNDPDINRIIDCVKANVPDGTTLGELSTWDKQYPVCNYTRGNPVCSPKCSHRRTSCHYGGDAGSSGAQAVDFGGLPGSGFFDPNLPKILSAAYKCSIKIARCEADGGSTVPCANPAASHVHVTSKTCDSL